MQPNRHGPKDHVTICSISNGGHRWALPELAAALVAGLPALASPATAAAKTFSVNPVTGKASNSGSATEQLKPTPGR